MVCYGLFSRRKLPGMEYHALINNLIQGFLLIASCCVTSVVAADTKQPDYVGMQVCRTCHAAQVNKWIGSPHDLAMQDATVKSVLGNFNNARFQKDGVNTTFYRKGDRFMVRTDGPDGKLTDYAIKYTFGVYPLQQYLIAFPGGRLQVLDIAWDSRPKGEGGQRWYALHPDEVIPAGDVLHWTGPNLNWNYMCADCHSTHLQKNYDAKTDAYNTAWSELNVSCEACHGPGSVHVDWAKGKAGKVDNKGLTSRLTERHGVEWKIDPETGKPRRSAPRQTVSEIEVCAPCHSRRSKLTDDYIPGQPFLDAYRPALLTEGLYYVDGQMQDEVYVYGSFLQSRMYKAGVTCSDCHEPHSTKLRAPGSQVCLQCHTAQRYATRKHHFHTPHGKGASCVECHMPPTVFMGVDARHDHSFRIPRPDQSVKYGTPNACTTCHTDKDASWAASKVRNWYGKDPQGLQQYASAFYASREQLPEASQLLKAVVDNQGEPPIARATALEQLGQYAEVTTYQAIKQGLQDPDPMLRTAALDAASVLDAQQRVVLAFPMLNDPVRIVRISAARQLASIPAGQLPEAERKWLQQALQEYVDVQLFNAERPESQFNLGMFYAEMQEPAKAEAAYRKSLQLQPDFIPSYVGLAQLLGQTGQEQQADALLRKGIQRQPDSAELYHSLGLSLVRQQRVAEAIPLFARSVRLAPTDPRYVYVYGVALNSSGQQAKAIEVMQAAHQQLPGNADILFGLVTFLRDAGRTQEAVQYARKLQALMPNNPAIKQLLLNLQSGT